MKLMTHARRKQAIVGIVGLAALGAGAYVATDHLTGSSPTAQPAPPPVVEPTSAVASPEPPTQTPEKKATTSEHSAAPSATPATKTRKQQIDEVRGTAAKAAGQVERPVVSATVDDADVTVKKVPVGAGMLQVMSARQDLTGKRELAWVSGQSGDKVGEASCTQKISLVAGAPPKKRDTLLICWRVSTAKSVYTVAVNPKGKPSAALSVSELNKVWSSF
jgi:cytoskeletal protein RodZ